MYYKGDKVRIVDAIDHSYIGKIGTVEDVDYEVPMSCKLTIDGKPGSWACAWPLSSIELVSRGENYVQEMIAMSRRGLSFKTALAFMRDNKLKARRHGWEGYWIWDEDKDTIIIHCKDDRVLDIRDTEDMYFTLTNILAEDWEVSK